MLKMLLLWTFKRDCDSSQLCCEDSKIQAVRKEMLTYNCKPILYVDICIEVYVFLGYYNIMCMVKILV